MHMGFMNGDFFPLFGAVAMPMWFYNALRSHGHLLLTCWKKAIGQNVKSYARYHLPLRPPPPPLPPFFLFGGIISA